VLPERALRRASFEYVDHGCLLRNASELGKINLMKAGSSMRAGNDRLTAPYVTLKGEEGRGEIVKQGYRLIVVDKAGVLVSEFQLTENALAQPEAFVTALKQSIEDIEEEEP
jgi:hypothetical protein